jgi:hypothetical protein
MKQLVEAGAQAPSFLTHIQNIMRRSLMGTPAPRLADDDEYRANLLQVWLIATTRPDLFDGKTADDFGNDPLPGDVGEKWPQGSPYYSLAAQVMAAACPLNDVRLAFSSFASTGWKASDPNHPGCSEFTVVMNP